MSAPALYAVQRPDGSLVQAAPCATLTDALWEAAGRDPEIRAFYNPESAYNVPTAKRKGYSFVAAVVVKAETVAAVQAVARKIRKARKR